MKTKTLVELAEEYGVIVDHSRLSDGSIVWNILIGDECVPCLSELHAREAVVKIGTALSVAMGD